MAELIIACESVKDVKAAIRGGADAVMFAGLDMFSRDAGLLPAAVKYCHDRAVRAYFSLKELPTDGQLASVADSIKNIAAAGADAISLSDIGVAISCRSVAPDMPLFAGPELGVFNLDNAAELKALGFKRVCAAKELNKYQIAFICQYCDIELNVSVYEDQCMSCDGQCHVDMLKKGYCEEFCRKTFSFAGTGRRRDEYPLNLKDLCLASHMDELGKLGAASFYVGHGSLKSPEELGLITAVFARLLAERRLPTTAELRELMRSPLHGGYTDGFFEGVPGPAMQGKRGSLENATVPVYDSDEELAALGDNSSVRRRRRTVSFYYLAEANKKSRLLAVDSLGNRAYAEGSEGIISDSDAENAPSGSRMYDAVKLRLSGVGAADWRVDRANVRIEDGIRINLGEINSLKSECLTALDKIRVAPVKRKVGRFIAPERVEGHEGKQELIFSYRSYSQIDDAAFTCSPEFIYLPIEELLSDKFNAERILGCGIRLAAVLPQIVTDNEVTSLRNMLAEAKAFGVNSAVVGNVGLIELVKDAGMCARGDYSLNVKNSYSLRAMSLLGLTSATLSFDMQLGEIRSVGKYIDTELFAYGRLPLMVTENCISRNHYGMCDKCESQRVLVGRDGENFPIIGIKGCRNMLLDSKKIYLADKLQQLEKSGAKYLRLQFTTENRIECSEIALAYRGKHGGYSPFTPGFYTPQKPWTGRYFAKG